MDEAFEPLVPLDIDGIEGMTTDEFVERNRKALMVLIFQKAFKGDREALGLAGKIVTAPYTEKAKMMAIGGGKAVGFEGLMSSGPMSALLKDMQTGKIKMDSFTDNAGVPAPPVPRNREIDHLAPMVGDHQAAVENAERRARFATGVDNPEFPRPRGLRVG